MTPAILYLLGLALTFAFLLAIVGRDEPLLKLAGLAVAWPLTWLVAASIGVVWGFCLCVEAVRR